MTSEIYNLEQDNITATVVTVPTGPPEVVVAYDGTSAPLTVFLNLGAVGFSGMAAQPPPADAIDWATPDPVRGTAHTVLAYRAVSVGRYDGAPKDRERALDAARLILERLARPSLPPPPDAPPPPVAATAANRASTRPSTASPVPPSRPNGKTIDAALTASGNDTKAAGTGEAVTLAIIVDSAMAPELRAVLGARSDITEERPVTWTTEVRFRGSIEEKHHPAVRFTVAVDDAREDELRVALSAYRLRSFERVATRPTAGVSAG